jgi:putative ABC transport system permease protein
MVKDKASRPALTRWPRTLAELIRLALKRLRYRPGLTLLALVAITLAVGMVSSAGFFAFAVDQQLLQQELATYTQETGRPPFSMRAYFLPYETGAISLETAEEFTNLVGTTLAHTIGLPLNYVGLEVESGSMLLQLPDDAITNGSQVWQSTNVNLVYYAGVADQLEFTGEPLDDGQSGDSLDVWVSNQFAEQAGIAVGDRYVVRRIGSLNSLPIVVKGIWKVRDPSDPFWFSNPEMTLKDAFLVRRQDFIEHIQPQIPTKTRFVAWHVLLDESQMAPANARRYISGIARAKVVLNYNLPNIRLDISPLEPLDQFVQRNRTLTTLLMGFNIPALAFLLYFLVLMSAIIARWQQRETAVLISRGIGLGSILGMTLIEELLLFLIGVPTGIALGMFIAQIMGRSVGFFSFIYRPPLPITLAGLNTPVVGLILVVSLLARLWTVAGASRHSVLTEERELSRPLRAPFWQRYYLDLLLIIPTAYTYRLLSNAGTLAMLVQDRPTDLYQDPLLILVPAFFILTLALLIMRIFPLITRFMDVIAGLMPRATLHLALRELSRQSPAYINPLLLIIACLALGIYSYSLSASLDQWLLDRMYYQAGADLNFQPEPLPIGQTNTGSTTADPSEVWGIPAETFLNIPGVAAATRVGEYSAEASFGGASMTHGRFLAVDRLTFPEVAWFRKDFTDQSLGALMNLLAQHPDGILVPQEVIDANYLQLGEPYHLSITLADNLEVEGQFTVVGTYHYFTTVYADRPTAIGNLDYFSSLIGAPPPANIWLRLQPGASSATVLNKIRDAGILPTRVLDAGALIKAEQDKMERVGVLGTLTVGFLAAAVMALTGLLIHTYASLNNRLHRFTVLHAIGLQRRQILGQVLLEYAFLTSYGAAAGALIGALATELFAPIFRVTGTREIILPPLIPVVSQDQIETMTLIFAGIMVLLELAVIATALYRRLFYALAPKNEG